MKIKSISICAMMTALLVICSWISIPSTIPFTLQTFAVFLIISLLDLKEATLTILAYLLLGCIGLPVFAGFGSGISSLVGPTGGFLISFILMPAVNFLLSKLFKNDKLKFIPLIITNIFCYICGCIMFIIVLGMSGISGIISALTLCVIPYIIPDLIKLGLAYIISLRLKPVVNKIKNQ